MRSRAFYVNCPICGRTLFKSRDAMEIEIQCPKCRNDLLIQYYKGKLILLEHIPGEPTEEAK